MNENKFTKIDGKDYAVLNGDLYEVKSENGNAYVDVDGQKL